MVVTWLGTRVRGNTHVLREQAFTAVRCCSTAPFLQTQEEVLREACGREGACGFCVEEKLNTEFLKETEKRREN